jgi:excisionase family DNA binding protein
MTSSTAPVPCSVGDTIIDRLKQRGSYLTTTEVMAIIGVTRATLCGWVRSGLISAVRIGKDNKFDPSTVARWLEARQV